MLDESRSRLAGSNPRHTADDCASRVRSAEWHLVTDTILDDNESRRVIRNASEKTRDRCDIGGFVSADDVVKWLRRLQWQPKDLVALAFVFDCSCIAISNTMVDSYMVLAMIGAVYVQALCGFVVSTKR